ncbi:MAG: ammonium transporter, Amt family [Solirubrobacteraceae bacterium]|nr:ammonium transporter, Amt family [Solirubrobacteraceae bacterium]
MRRTMALKVLPAVAAGMLVALVLPELVSADTVDAAGASNGGVRDTVGLTSVGVNTMWVIVAGMVVMFMQAGFMFLEIGFSRQKNAGTVVAKVLTNFSICAICWYFVGFAFAFGASPHGLSGVIGGTGFLLRDFGDPTTGFPVMGFSNATPDAKFFFQFVFAAVSLAIVWGSTLERIKFGVYIIYAVIFSCVIYPIGAHWVFGGGFLQTPVGLWKDLGFVGMQDFAGSTAVHLIGATGALAVLLLLGPRKGKYGGDGKPRAIPGHNMPLFGLAVMVLWLGWFGFNPGSTLNIQDGRFAEIVLVTNLAAACGVLGALLMSRLMQKTLDIGMIGNGAIGALVAITAPSGYVELWAAIPIGLVAGLLIPPCVLWIDKKVDDPVGVLTAHGICGIWGTFSCGLFTAPRLADYNAVGNPEGGLLYSGSFSQLAAQVAGFTVAFAFVFAMSYATFFAIKKTYGLRVTEEEEDAGLDISEHGMYGYPEAFIPAAELIGYGGGASATIPPAPVTAMSTKEMPA